MSEGESPRKKICLDQSENSNHYSIDDKTSELKDVPFLTNNSEATHTPVITYKNYTNDVIILVDFIFFNEVLHV